KPPHRRLTLRANPIPATARDWRGPRRRRSSSARGRRKSSLIAGPARSKPKSPSGNEMLKPLRAMARQFEKRIGWNRVGVPLSITIIAVAAVVLYRMLHDIEVREVIWAVRMTPARDLFLAGLFVAAGYFTLTFYDLFALRTIGWNTVPYRAAALAGFTSYSI